MVLEWWIRFLLVRRLHSWRGEDNTEDTPKGSESGAGKFYKKLHNTINNLMTTGGKELSEMWSALVLWWALYLREAAVTRELWRWASDPLWLSLAPPHSNHHPEHVFNLLDRQFLLLQGVPLLCSTPSFPRSLVLILSCFYLTIFFFFF